MGHARRSKTRPPLDRALRGLRIEELWARGIDGRGIRVAHVDTGVDPAHPVLAGRVVRFAGTELDGTLRRDRAPGDPDGHGSHVAGLICGQPQRGRSIGVAPGAQLESVTALEGGQTLVRVLEALRWVHEGEARVVCLALGTLRYNPVLWTALAALRRRDMSIVAAMGNVGAQRGCCPAILPGVLSVGACRTSRAGGHLTWSGLGMSGFVRDERARVRAPVVVAPGFELPSLGPGPRGIAPASGTSQACGVVAGIVALLRQAVPDASAYQVETALARTARPRPSAGEGPTWSRHGLVQPEPALALLRESKENLPAYRRVPVDPPEFHDARAYACRRPRRMIVVARDRRRRGVEALRDRIARLARSRGVATPTLSSWPEARVVWGNFARALRDELRRDSGVLVSSAGDIGRNVPDLRIGGLVSGGV